MWLYMVDNFGFIHKPVEIKVLILFVMRRLPEAVTMSELTELTMCDNAISYFDVTDCIDNLIKTEHLRLDSDKKYFLSEKGKHNGEILEKDLPYSVKEKAEAATALVRAAQARNSMIKTSRNCEDDGSYEVTLSLSDGVSEIISIKLVAANENQAIAMENGFRKSAEEIYKSVVAMTMGKL